MLRRWKSFAGLTSLTACLVLMMSAVGALPVAAGQGDVWTQPKGTAEKSSGHSQEVHLTFGDVDIWGDKLDRQSGPWVLYDLPPSNSPGPGTVIARGTYAYHGDGAHVIATIPRSVFQNAGGNHFKIEVDNHKSKTFWVDCPSAKPTLTTTPNPKSATLGATLKDTAKLGRGSSPAGTIKFTLYNPSNAVAHTETVDVHGNGSYSTPTGYVAGVAGTWHWKAEFSGDAKNKPVASNAADEPVVVTEEHERLQPSISTTPSPTSANVGATLKDSATLSGGHNPTGTITFTLYNPSNAAVHSETVNVDGNSTYSTPTGHVAGVAGTWHWKAEYSGDQGNKRASSCEADEPVVVTEEHERLQPSISTTPNPTSANVGATLKDSATLSGGSNPTGTITFTLYDQNGAVAHSETVSVEGNGAYSTATGHVAGTAGTWHWKAEYSGDANNKPVASNAADEPVVVTQEHERAQPSISTTPNPTSANAGATLKDSATLSGGSNPTGTVTFTLYNPSNAVAYTETVSVTGGNGTYSTATGHVADVAGTWHWKAEYSGDANNKPVASNAADEPVVVNATGGVLAATGSTPLAELLALVLVGFGGLAILTGAVAWRRRTS